jgi:hypothetical protein
MHKLSNARYTRAGAANRLRYISLRKLTMLYTIAAVLFALWLFGVVTSYTLAGLIHVLLVIAIVVALLKVIGGRSST